MLCHMHTCVFLCQVRIKVQDDNDLKAANGALTSCAEFFSNLQIYGSRRGLKPIDVIDKLEQSF